MAAQAASLAEQIPEPAPHTPLGLMFPTGFIWGAATSAYQIEGATTEDGRGDPSGTLSAASRGGSATATRATSPADHYHRYPDHLDLMRDLGLHSYRFSIAWPRVMPDGPGRSTSAGWTSTGGWSTGCTSAASRRWPPCSTGTSRSRCRTRAAGSHRDTALPVRRLRRRGLRRARRRRAHLAHHQRAQDRGAERLPVRASTRPVSGSTRRGLRGRAPPALAHGLAVQALRATGAPAGSARRSTCTRRYPADDSEAAAAAADLHDGYENRLYLDPMLRGRLPARTCWPTSAPAAGWPRSSSDGDLEIISSPGRPAGGAVLLPDLRRRATGETVSRWPTSQAFWQQIYPQGLYDILTRVTARLRRRADLHHRERPALAGRARPGRHGGRPGPDRVPARPLRRRAPGDRAPGVQLESYHVWSLLDNFEWQQGYDRALGPGLCGLRHPAAHPEAQRPVVPGRDRPQRHLRALPGGKKAPGQGSSHWGRGRERGLPRPPAPDPAPATVRWPGSSRRCRGSAGCAPGTARACRGRRARRPTSSGTEAVAALRSPSAQCFHIGPSSSLRPSHSWNARYTGTVMYPAIAILATVRAALASSVGQTKIRATISLSGPPSWTYGHDGRHVVGRRAS